MCLENTQQTHLRLLENSVVICLLWKACRIFLPINCSGSNRFFVFEKELKHQNECFTMQFTILPSIVRNFFMFLPTHLWIKRILRNAEKSPSSRTFCHVRSKKMRVLKILMFYHAVRYPHKALEPSKIHQLFPYANETNFPLFACSSLKKFWTVF